MILITGSNSLLGQALLERLVKTKEKIRCLDLILPEKKLKDVKYIEGNLLDKPVLEKALNKVTIVYHLLDIHSYDTFDRSTMKKVNITGTKNLLSISEKNGVNRFFFLSTYEVYGKLNTIPVRQDDKKKPATKYGKDKLKAENECWKYVYHSQMSVTIFRPAAIAGAGTKNPLILITLYLALAMGDASRLYITGDGDLLFQLLHPDDGADALAAILGIVNTNSRVYNLGSNNVLPQIEQIVKIKELAKLDCRIKHISMFKIKFLSFLLRPMKLPYLNKNNIAMLSNHILMDCQWAKKDFNWEPKRNNIDIMLEVINWYKKEVL